MLVSKKIGVDENWNEKFLNEKRRDINYNVGNKRLPEEGTL